MNRRLPWLVEQEQLRLAHDGPLPINRRLDQKRRSFTGHAEASPVLAQWISQLRVGVANLRRRMKARRLSEERRLVRATKRLASYRHDALHGR